MRTSPFSALLNNETSLLASPVNCNYPGTVYGVRLEPIGGDVVDVEVGVFGSARRRECEALTVWVVDEDNVRHEMRAGDPRYSGLSVRAEDAVYEAERVRFRESQEP